MLDLTKFILSHDNWEELLSSEPYNLKIYRDGIYVLFKYSQTTSNFNIPLVREARGIIFREDTWKCVCHPFDKFGNYGESYCPDIDWHTASVQEKIDGSLIKIWFDENEWHISTNGTIDAFKAELSNIRYKNFGELVFDTISATLDIDRFFSILNTEHTYMFELVSPYNRVVVPYNMTKLFLLGIRDNNGKEINPVSSKISSFFEVPKRHEMHCLEDVVRAASKLPWDKEGYVVCDEKYNRVKIKSPQYIIAHYARANGIVNIEKFIQIILDGEQKEFLIYASDYADELQKVEEAMHEIAHNAVKEMKIIYGATFEFESRGQYAKYAIKRPNYMKDFLFHCYDDRIFWDYAKSWSAAKWAKAIEELRNNE